MDESGSDDRTGDRSYGWSNKGVRAVVERWLASRTRVSVIPAYTLDGYIKATIFEGTCIAQIVENFIIEELFPVCNAYPGPRSVLVLDDASVRHASLNIIRRACQVKGVWIRFLPLYSPDFNPIEESFGDLKAFIRRYSRRERRRFSTDHGFFEWAIREFGVGQGAAKRARTHFRHAGV